MSTDYSSYALEVYPRRSFIERFGEHDIRALFDPLSKTLYATLRGWSEKYEKEAWNFHLAVRIMGKASRRDSLIAHLKKPLVISYYSETKRGSKPLAILKNSHHPGSVLTGRKEDMLLGPSEFGFSIDCSEDFEEFARTGKSPFYSIRFVKQRICYKASARPFKTDRS